MKPCIRPRTLLLSSLFFAFLFSSVCSLGTKLELIHRHQLRRNQQLSQLEKLRQLLRSDSSRIKKLSRDRDGTMEDREASGEMPMWSGADYGTGQYFVEFRVGTPPQKVMLIADSGSDLTWMKCRYRCRGGLCNNRKLKDHRVFLGDRSETFRAVPCSSRMCRVQLADMFSLARCLSPMEPCAYDYRYSDGSSTLGFFANETVTLTLTNRRKLRLENVLIGCSDSSLGQTFNGADGVLGLGYSSFSFALKSSQDQRFNGKFSYCLVDHLSSNTTSSYLIFGQHEEIPIPVHKMEYTQLTLGVLSSYYAVNIKGISVGGLFLEIPSEVWNPNVAGGAIVDSGSSLTFLTRPAYEPVMAAIKVSLLNFEKLDLDMGPLEYCFNSTGFDESLVPRLVFHFEDGARFEPYVKSYVVDAADGVTCLGIVPASWPGASVIGNIMQQNYLWEFDVINGRLGFASSSCR